jgi:CRP/FNR family transcriptional regulator, cyclic AMP receptor protein
MTAVREPASLPLIDLQLTLARLRRSVRGTVRSFAARTPLGRHGEPLGAVHLVLSGLVSVTSTSNAGRRTILALVGPGGVVGQESALSGRIERIGPSAMGWSTPLARGFDLQHVEAEAFSACTTLVLPASDLEVALDRDPLIAMWVAASLGQRLRAMERTLIRMVSLPVKERLVEVLLEVGATHGERRSWGTIVAIPLSQDDLAAMVGATRESVNRALRVLEEAGEVCRVDGAYAVRWSAGVQDAVPGVS